MIVLNLKRTSVESLQKWNNTAAEPTKPTETLYFTAKSHARNLCDTHTRCCQKHYSLYLLRSLVETQSLGEIMLRTDMLKDSLLWQTEVSKVISLFAIKTRDRHLSIRRTVAHLNSNQINTFVIFWIHRNNTIWISNSLRVLYVQCLSKFEVLEANMYIYLDSTCFTTLILNSFCYIILLYYSILLYCSINTVIVTK